MVLVVGTQAENAYAVILNIPDCMTPCEAPYKECFERVKESPNDIERELCAEEKKECRARCDAEVQVVKDEYNRKVNEERQERIEQGLRPRKSGGERTEELDEHEQEKVEKLEQTEQERKEQQEKEAEQKRQEDTINGTIKIFQFNK